MGKGPCEVQDPDTYIPKFGALTPRCSVSQPISFADPEDLAGRLDVELFAELSTTWNVTEADAALMACWGAKKASQEAFDKYSHGPLALLRVNLESEEVSPEVPRQACCTVCECGLNSNKDYPLPRCK